LWPRSPTVVSARSSISSVLDARRRILGDDHPDTLTAKANLAGSLWALGKHGRLRST